MPASKHAAIYTLGCRLNHAESSLIADRLRCAGYTLVEDGAPADLCVINTCTVTGEADAKSRKMIRAFIRKHPEAFIAVVGCYSQVASKEIARIPGVDLVLGSEDKLGLLDYVAQAKNAQPNVVCRSIARNDFRIDIRSPKDEDAPGSIVHRANLKIQDGCDMRCSYCIVPFARGPARSREMDNLLEEARELVRRGVQEIVVTGVNVGAYRYNGQGLLDVIDRLSEIPGVRRLRIGSIEFGTIPDGLLDRMKDDAHPLVPFLHLPLQSGSDRILTLMKRPYTARDFSGFMRKASMIVPGLGLGVDVLVGFPGETDEDFAETARLLKLSPMAYAHVFKYSARPGTEAADLADPVDPPTAQRRSEIVRELSDAKRAWFHAWHLGRRMDVLFEDIEDGSWRGYTGNYIRVAICCSDKLENVTRPVILEQDQGEYVSGRLTS